ncbi:MAG TPA: IclR family transcriptional regulator C-terminal domain-containing protein [Xanthobacteraceae bacterium]|jgi:IclR family mhp operon transcriptional activator|nr:IclR family transcriptional regulator C-terminal domain-containing protein [Xanthobacteraceae bacterium]
MQAQTGRLRDMTERRGAPEPAGSSKPINSVIKTIKVMAVLSHDQVASVDHLSRETRIPKPSILRILQTLTQCGLVKQISRRAGYCLTSKILSLSSGFYGLPEVIEVGAPFADALTQELLWPTAIATLDVDAMVVRHSTMMMSPHAHVRSTMNKRLSLTDRAHGRAYLAFCGQAERESLLRIVGGAKGQSSSPRRTPFDRRRLLWHLKAARRAGYAKRAIDLDPQTSTIAVPVFADKGVRATLGMTFFTSAVDKATEAHLGRRLIEAATTIGVALNHAGGRR